MSTVLFAREGEMLGARRAADGQWRFPPRDRVPDKFAQAIVTFEDKRFYNHHGVDLRALARAVRNALRARRFMGGASTLTMQVVRLSRGNPRRTVFEKFTEILLALRLDAHRSKNEILTLYAAHAPFGGNVVGLEAAAWRYFGRSPDQLSWAEAAVLAVLPNSPGLIHPGRRREELKEKRDRLLERLSQKGVLDDLDLKLSKEEPLPDRPKPWPNWAPHLLSSLPNGERASTSLDATLQKSLVETVNKRAEGLEQRGIGNAAALVVDHASFRVLAYVGNSRSSTEGEKGAAIDLVRRPRGTGSLLKPLLFAVALEEGLLAPNTLLADIPIRIAGFQPENMDRGFRGAVPAREALSRSFNIPFVRLLRQYGVPRFHAVLKNMGFSHLFRPPDDYGLTLILGGAEASLWDLTAAHANLARVATSNRKAFQAPYTQITLNPSAPPPSGATTEFGPGAAWLTLSALNDVARPDDEAHWQQFAHARRIAWKTGTSQGFRDGWAIGSDGRHTVGVWTGNASGEGVPGLTGGTAAAPLLFDIFNRLGPGGWFPKPDYDLREIPVCADDGFRPAAGCVEKMEDVPLNSLFDKQSLVHRWITLDPVSRQRVHSGCVPVHKMTSVSWWTLPPAQEYFYRRRHPEYKPLPPWRADCRDTAPADQRDNPLEFLYPDEGARIYIPRDFGGEKGVTVFEAVHRVANQTLDWHLNATYLGRTRSYHQQALNLPPGSHVITVVDREGHRASRSFHVIGPDAP